MGQHLSGSRSRITGEDRLCVDPVCLSEGEYPGYISLFCGACGPISLIYWLIKYLTFSIQIRSHCVLSVGAMNRAFLLAVCPHA